MTSLGIKDKLYLQRFMTAILKLKNKDYEYKPSNVSVNVEKVLKIVLSEEEDLVFKKIIDKISELGKQEEIFKKLISEVSDNSLKVSKNINELCEKLVNEINKRKNKLLNENESVKNEKISKLKNQLNDITTYKKDVMNVCFVILRLKMINYVILNGFFVYRLRWNVIHCYI